MAEWRMDQFNAQSVANTAWAFATVGQKDEQLFKELARMAERRMDQFNAQEFAEQYVGHFVPQALLTTLYALSWHEYLRVAWSSFEHAERLSVPLSPQCFEALLLKCEQRGLSEHEIALLEGLEGATGNHSIELSFGAPMKFIAAVRLAETISVHLLHSQFVIGFLYENHRAGNECMYLVSWQLPS